MNPNVDALQSYVAGTLTELIAAWYLAYAIEGRAFTPSPLGLFAEFRQPLSILKGFEVKDNFNRLEHSVVILLETESKNIEEYVLEGLRMGQYLVDHILSGNGLRVDSLTDIVSIEWAAEDLSSQADLRIRYKNIDGVLQKVEYSAKSGESPPAAQSRGLETYCLTVAQCRYFYFQGVKTWLADHPILYPTIDKHGYEIDIDGQYLRGLMDLNNHRSRDEGIDLEHVPSDFYTSYEEWNTHGNVAMCDALLQHMTRSIDGKCMAYHLVNEYLTLAEQSGAVLYILQPDSPPSLQSELLRACVKIRTAAIQGNIAGEIRRKPNVATWVICDTNGCAVLGIMIRNALGRGPRPGTGKAHSVPERVKVQITLAEGQRYDGVVLASFTKSSCVFST